MASNFSPSNPFRRKSPSSISTNLPESPPSSQVAFPQIEPEPRTSSLGKADNPKKITKKVRVQSPPPPSPSTPDSSSTISDDEAYPFPESISQNDGPFDPIDTGSSEDWKSSRLSRAPANPFSRTLETLEHPTRASQAAQPATSAATLGKAPLDVDAFKRLLMTGDSGVATAAASLGAQTHITHGLGDGGSSTDTSSISRQSMFEAIQENHPESPRTSHELSEPEYDRNGLTAEPQSPQSARKKPPPPSSRHGKLIKVELRDDLGVTTALQSPPTPAPISSQQYFSSGPNSQIEHSQSQTDLNKPLPPAPNRASHDSERESIFDKEAAGKTPEPRSPSPTLSIMKKAPPAPPLARRHSQLVSESRVTRSDSGRLSPKVEEDIPAVGGQENNRSRSDSFKVPPPPPFRRPASIRNVPTQPPLLSPSTASVSNPPPPPPTRGSSRSISGGKPPSIHSLDISSSNKRSSMIPPPPPPPRHGRKSSESEAQSPGTSRRPSGEYLRRSGEHSRRSIDSTRRDSIASLAIQEDPQAVDESQNDILADLSKLQREIDALRVQSEKDIVT